MKKYLITLFVLVNIIACSQSPEELKRDSDRLFYQAIEYYERGYLTQATNLFEKVIDIENKLGNNQRRANCLIYLGLIYYQISDFERSMSYYNRALKIFHSMKDEKNQLLVLNNIAGIKSMLGDYDEAVKIYSDIIGRSVIFNDKESEAIALLNLGELFLDLWDFEKSYDYFNRAHDSYKVLGDSKGIIYSLNKIGIVFFQSKNYIEALKAFDLAIETNRKSGSKYLIQEIYNNIGLIYFNENQITKAKEFFEIAWNSLKVIESNQQMLITLQNNLGDCEYQNQLYSKAIEYYKEALNLSEKSFLKFLSPILQLKIAKSYEHLYFINKSDYDRKNAETFYQFALKRFEENDDWRNLQIALTEAASFYFRINNQKNLKKISSKLQDLKFSLELMQDENIKYFALKPEFDLTFLAYFVNQNKSDVAFSIFEVLKLQNALEYFLRYKDFKFLQKDQAEKFQSLKKEILIHNTYQKIFTQEISLPEQQRIKSKIRIAEKKLEESSRKIFELLKSLTIDFEFLKPFTNKVQLYDLINSHDKVYIELVPTDQNLICFFITSDGIDSKLIEADTENLKFNLKILSQNIDSFNENELKNFSSSNFGRIIDKIISEITLKNPMTEKIVFLVNGNYLDFVQHLFYSETYDQFITEKFDVSYSYFINDELSQKPLKFFGALNDGEINSLTFDLQDQQNREKENSQKSKRIGFKDQIKKRDSFKGDNQDLRKFDVIFSIDELLFNESTPELIYFTRQYQKNTYRFYFRNILEYQPDLIILRSIKYKQLKQINLLFALLSFVNLKSVIFPIANLYGEFSFDFLYNYKKRVENKKLQEAFKEFFNQLNRKVKNYRSEFFWIKFLN